MKSISVKSVGNAAEFAMVCSPDKMEFWNWSDSAFLLRKVVHPICHLVSVIILLIVAITYFVLPPLRFVLYYPPITKTNTQFMFGLFNPILAQHIILLLSDSCAVFG